MAKKPLRVLFVEDSENDLLLLLREFSKSNYEIDYIRVDTEVAMTKALQEKTWDIIISDYVMPQFSALDAFGTLRKTSIDIPFIIVSGTIGEETAVEAMRAGVHDYIMKGNLTRLLPSIERELRDALSREQKRNVESSLTNSEERKAAILESAFDPVVSMDQYGNIIEFNPAAERVFGYKKEEIMGKEMAHYLVPDRLREGHRDGLVWYLKSGTSVMMNRRLEMFAKRADGTEFPAELTITKINSSGPPTFTGFIRDITEIKRIEAEREEISRREHDALDVAVQAAKMKDEFLANMSHEIRTLLNAVIGLTEVLLDTNLDLDQRSLLCTIKESGSSLLSIVNDILDFAKIEAGKIELDDTAFSIRAMVDSQIELLSPLAKSKGLVLMSYVAPDVPEFCLGDQGRVGQVLMNLIGNAIKFTSRGKVIVKVAVDEKKSNTSLNQTKNNKLNIRFSIVDTGIGLATEMHTKLFHPFSQADGSTTRKYGGTGLGLSICKKLVECMGGDIGFESQIGVGSTFWFLLPLELADSNRTNKNSKNTVESKDKNLKKVVLVAEDNGANQIVIQRQLGKLGYDCHIVDNGKEAVEAILNKTYDLVILDCQMPVMDGLEAAQEIRKLELKNQGSKRMPVIALTAHAMSNYREKCLASGMDDYISKPVDLELLSKIISQWVSAHTPQENN